MQSRSVLWYTLAKDPRLKRSPILLWPCLLPSLPALAPNIPSSQVCSYHNLPLSPSSPSLIFSLPTFFIEGEGGMKIGLFHFFFFYFPFHFSIYLLSPTPHHPQFHHSDLSPSFSCISNVLIYPYDPLIYPYDPLLILCTDSKEDDGLMTLAIINDSVGKTRAAEMAIGLSKVGQAFTSPSSITLSLSLPSMSSHTRSLFVHLCRAHTSAVSPMS